MKVEINTKDLSVYVQGNDITSDPLVIDQWITALRVAREWLRQELERVEKNGQHDIRH
jgi:hypothetical protein